MSDDAKPPVLIPRTSIRKKYVPEKLRNLPSNDLNQKQFIMSPYKRKAAGRLQPSKKKTKNPYQKTALSRSTPISGAKPRSSSNNFSKRTLPSPHKTPPRSSSTTPSNPPISGAKPRSSSNNFSKRTLPSPHKTPPRSSSATPSNHTVTPQTVVTTKKRPSVSFSSKQFIGTKFAPFQPLPPPSIKSRMLESMSNDESSESETSDDSMIGQRKKPSCARRISDEFKFDDDASNENDISSEKEPSARSTVGERTLNEEQDGNYDLKDDAPKGHDISNAELELYFKDDEEITFKTPEPKQGISQLKNSEQQPLDFPDTFHSGCIASPNAVLGQPTMGTRAILELRQKKVKVHQKIAIAKKHIYALNTQYGNIMRSQKKAEGNLIELEQESIFLHNMERMTALKLSKNERLTVNITGGEMALNSNAINNSRTTSSNHGRDNGAFAPDFSLPGDES